MLGVGGHGVASSVCGLPWRSPGRSRSHQEVGPARPAEAGKQMLSKSLQPQLHSEARMMTTFPVELTQAVRGERQHAQQQAQTKAANQGRRGPQRLEQTWSEAGACRGGADRRQAQQAGPGRRPAARAQTSWTSRRFGPDWKGHPEAVAHAGPNRSRQRTSPEPFGTTVCNAA